MNDQVAKEIADKIIGQVFGYQNPMSLEQILQKFAFDVRLPQQVYDSIDNSPTWAQSTNPTKFITMDKSFKGFNGREDWLQEKRPLNSVEEILEAWGSINYTTTERQLDSLNVAQSDNIYNSENIYRSQDVNQCKNILFSDSLSPGCEFIIAGQRSNASSFCVRLEDSTRCSNSFSVSWSNNISNSLFISDCKDLQDCMFCSHHSTGRFMIANMQFEEAEYMRLRDMVIRWILTS